MGGNGKLSDRVIFGTQRFHIGEGERPNVYDFHFFRPSFIKIVDAHLNVSFVPSTPPLRADLYVVHFC